MTRNHSMCSYALRTLHFLHLRSMLLLKYLFTSISTAPSMYALTLVLAVAVSSLRPYLSLRQSVMESSQKIRRHMFPVDSPSSKRATAGSQGVSDPG